MAYSFLALDMLGEQIEEPFGTKANDLTLDASESLQGTWRCASRQRSSIGISVTPGNVVTSERDKR